jgi:ribosome maturation factor RimP
MAKSRQAQRIIEALEGEALAKGFELVDVEIAGAVRKPLLRIWLDTDQLTLDDIAAANSWIAAKLDELDPVKGSYTLEVSSPGIDRPLRTLEHFERFVGQKAVIVSEAINGRSRWTGLLSGVIKGEDGDSKIVLELDSKSSASGASAPGGRTATIAFAQIKKANLKGELGL